MLNTLKLFKIEPLICAWLLLTIFFLSTIRLYGQDRDKTKKEVRKVADQIIRKTSFRFEDTQTGRQYKSIQKLPKMKK